MVTPVTIDSQNTSKLNSEDKDIILPSFSFYIHNPENDSNKYI